jgi:hypothetical protein
VSTIAVTNKITEIKIVVPEAIGVKIPKINRIIPNTIKLATIKTPPYSNWYYKCV